MSMDLILFDGFEDGSVNKWAPLPTRGGVFAVANQGRRGGYAALVVQGGDSCITKSFSSSITQSVIGHAKKFMDVNCKVLGQFRDIGLNDGANFGKLRFYIGTYGEIYANREISGSSPVTVATSAHGAISYDGWHYVEIGVVCHTSTGSILVKVDGSIVINSININTSPGGYNVFDWVDLGLGLGNDCYIDDVYLTTGTGTLSTGFLGDCRVDRIYPNATGTHSDFSPVGDTPNYACVDETVSDGDSTYVTSSTIGDKDTYNFSNVTINGTIYGLEVSYTAKKTDAGFIGIKPLLITGGVEYEGDRISVTDSYVEHTEIFTTNPGTGLLWTVSQVNAIEAGVELVT